MSTVHEGGSASILGSLSAQGSLRSRVTEVLREAMVAGELEPGQIYSAPVLAQKLGVSPTPVREAMMELAREGLVEALCHRGYRILQFSEATLEHIRELREMIEVPAVGRVAEAGHEVQGLRPLADELDRTAAEGELQASIAWTLPMTILALSLRLSSVPVLSVLRRGTRRAGRAARRCPGSCPRW